jgi:hypothetical protein
MAVILEIEENLGLLENKTKIKEYLAVLRQRQAYKKAAQFG